MADKEILAGAFEANRAHLRTVAYRMLGSNAEAEDAVQEAWLRLARAGTAAVQNLRGWLPTVVARIFLHTLPRPQRRRLEPIPPHAAQAHAPPHSRTPAPI